MLVYQNTVKPEQRKRQRDPHLKITLNPDPEMVRVIKQGLKDSGGYCPCRLDRTEEYKCMCQEFRDQIADPDYEGFCHCMLYYKEK